MEKKSFEGSIEDNIYCSKSLIDWISMMRKYHSDNTIRYCLKFFSDRKFWEEEVEKDEE